MLITDKELLTICNLSNLKMEFANLEKDSAERSENENQKNNTNHTIYSLIKKEIEKMQERIQLELNGIPLDKNIDYGSFIQYTGNVESKENELEKEYPYASKRMLIEEAPIIMEYFDSYCESNYQSRNEGAFLNQWEILYAGDNISLVIYTLNYLYEAINESLEETLIECKKSQEISVNSYSDKNFTILDKKKLEKEHKNINSKNYRIELEGKRRNQEILEYIIDILDNPVTGTLIDMTVSKALSKILFLSIFWEKIDEKLGSFIGNILKNNNPELNKKYGEFFTDILSTIQVFDKETELDLVKENLIKKVTENKERLQKISLIKNFDLSDESIHFCVTKKENTIVIAIRDDKNLTINEELNKGVVPKYLFYLEPLYKKVKKDYPTSEIIFTGTGNAGKISMLCSIYLGGISKGFFREKPTNLKSIIDFTEKDLSQISENLEYYNNHEFVFKVFIDTGEKVVAYMIPKLIPLLISIIRDRQNLSMILSFILISKLEILLGLLAIIVYISNLLENINRTKGIFKELEKYKIIKNLNLSSLGINYSSEKILGEINDKAFDSNTFYEYKFTDNISYKVNLFSLLVILVIKYCYDYTFNHIDHKNNEIVFIKEKGGGNYSRICELRISIEEGKYKKILTSEYIISRKESKEDFEIWNLAYELSQLIFYFYIFQSEFKKYNQESSSKIKYYYFEKNVINNSKIIDFKVSKQENKVEKDGEIESLFAPYLDSSTGEIMLNKISEEYKASFIRSCFNLNEDYNEKNISERIEDEDYDLILFGISTSLDKETLNESLFKIMEDRGKKIALPEHYESVMKEFKENLKLIEKYYVIEEDKYSKNRAELNLGIFNEMKSYAPERMGFAYSSLDKIRVGLTRVPLYFLDKVDVSSIKTTKVCSGAILECNCGTAPKELVVTSQGNYTADGRLIATKEDKQRLLNIGDFGSCKCKDNKPCKYFISLKEWNEVSPNNRLNGKNILLSSSTISCNIGGVIEIKDSKCKFNAN